MKTAVFAAKVMELLGYETEPGSDQVRHDIIQMIHMKEPEALKKFCKGIQFGAPVDSYVTPEPWDMPGYDCQVIMAAGAFIQGASIELSADAPMREPYTVYLQGGLTFESGRLGVLLAVEELLRLRSIGRAAGRIPSLERGEGRMDLLWRLRRISVPAPAAPLRGDACVRGGSRAGALAGPRPWPVTCWWAPSGRLGHGFLEARLRPMVVTAAQAQAQNQMAGVMEHAIWNSWGRRGSPMPIW